MQDFIISVMDRFGYAGICFLIMLENLFPPIPSEVILPLGGFMTTYTSMQVGGVIFFATIGSTLGAILLYRAGTLASTERLERLMDTKVCRLLGFRKKEVAQAVEWFEKKGNKAVLFGRCVPIVRSLVSIPAGMARMKQSLFLVYTIIGSLIWNFLLITLGAVLGASWEKILDWFSAYAEITGFFLKTGMLLLILRMIWKRIVQK